MCNDALNRFERNQIFLQPKEISNDANNSKYLEIQVYRRIKDGLTIVFNEITRFHETF